MKFDIRISALEVVWRTSLDFLRSRITSTYIKIIEFIKRFCRKNTGCGRETIDS